MRKIKLPFIVNRTETIHFKKFCEGGSPAFTEAKRNLKELYVQQQQTNLLNRRNKATYSLYINPLAFFDGHFLIAGLCVVLVAVLEKKLAANGIFGIAAALSGLLRIALPVVALGSMIYLISQLGIFL